MTAQDYPISFPYGATSPPYSPTRPHRGNDRACPAGTPIVVVGTQIGLVGSTGLADGPHLHTQAGTDIACQNTFNPTPLEFKPGRVVNTGVGSQWGNFVTVQVGNQYITYCHLQRIDVSVGQELNEDMRTKVTTAVNRIIHTEMEGWPYQETHAGKFDKQLEAAWNGRDLEEMIWSKWNQDGAFREARERNRLFYEKYASVIDELGSRPTKAQYDEAMAKLAAEAGKVEAANKKADEALEKAKQLEAQKTEDSKLLDEGSGVFAWITKLFNRIKRK